MTIETSKSPNPRNRKGISVIKLKFLSVSSMNTLLAILKVTDARRDVILARGLYHRFPWRHLPPLRCKPMSNVTITTYLHKLTTPCQLYTPSILIYMSTAFKIGQPRHLKGSGGCAYHTVQKDSRGVLGTSFRFSLSFFLGR